MTTEQRAAWQRLMDAMKYERPIDPAKVRYNEYVVVKARPDSRLTVRRA